MKLEEFKVYINHMKKMGYNIYIEEYDCSTCIFYNDNLIMQISNNIFFSFHIYFNYFNDLNDNIRMKLMVLLMNLASTSLEYR